MKLWVTRIRAKDPKDGEMKLWFGPNVPGINKADAQQYCTDNELGYCKVWRELLSEVPAKEDGITADWEKEINYENISNN